MRNGEGNMRVLIVDDEPLARSALENILATRNDVDVFHSAKDAVDALDKVRKEAYDVLLLDIHMPELSGIELVDCMKEQNQPVPAVIFVTAHHEHAIAAFEKHAVDYVLKPFSNERIHKALNVAMRRTASERAAKLMEILPELRTLLSKPAKMAIKIEGRILFVDPAEVIAVEAEGNYVLLQRPAGSYLLRGSISALAEKLRPYGFIRIHRSVLVNASCVQEIQPWTTGEYLLRTRGGKEYTVSRTYKRNLRSISHVWIGSESLFAE
jgi:two-component system, LytTR family, response regulator